MHEPKTYRAAFLEQSTDGVIGKITTGNAAIPAPDKKTAQKIAEVFAAGTGGKYDGNRVTGVSADVFQVDE